MARTHLTATLRASRLPDHSGGASILTDENSEIIRAISQTIPVTFWIEPRPKGRTCNLREIFKDIDTSSKGLNPTAPSLPSPHSLGVSPTDISLFLAARPVCKAEAELKNLSVTSSPAPRSSFWEWGESLTTTTISRGSERKICRTGRSRSRSRFVRFRQCLPTIHQRWQWSLEIRPASGVGTGLKVSIHS
jgi:hypothetical protein